MKRQPKTLTAQRLVLTAPDGSPRIELFVAPNGTPHLKMMDDKGAVRLEVGLGDEKEEEVGWAASIALCDGLGLVHGDGEVVNDGIEVQVDVNFLTMRASVGGIRVMDYWMDGLQLAAGVKRREAARAGGGSHA